MLKSIRRGDTTIHRIIEFEASFMPALDMLPGLTPALLNDERGLLDPSEFDDNDYFRLCYQSFLLETPDSKILIDSCVGDHKTHRLPLYHLRSGSKYLERLADVGCSVEDIDFVMCTHLHVDHVGWNTRLDNGIWKPTFPNARYIFNKREFEFWTKRHAEDPQPVFAESVLPVVAARQADIVGDSFELRDHVRLMPTPGHTPGHVAVRIGKSRDQAVVTGDLAHVSLQARHPELPFYRDRDRDLAAVTRRNFFDRFCDTDTVCCFTHSPARSFCNIKPWKTSFICESVSG